MTRNELFTTFPRPWRMKEDNIVDADGRAIAQLDPFVIFEDEECTVIAGVICNLVNEAASE